MTTPSSKDGWARFKDQLLLLVCAIVLSVAGWLIHVGLGDWTPTVLLCATLLIQSAQIRQLKSEVRRLQTRYEPDAKPPL